MKNKKGFTLIEIIVVVVILAVLLAVAVPSVLKYLNEADSAKFLATSRSIFQEITIDYEKEVASGKSFDTICENMKDKYLIKDIYKPIEIGKDSIPGYNVREITCCFDGINTDIKGGWQVDSTLSLHTITKIVITYVKVDENNVIDVKDLKYVVVLPNGKMYFYKNTADAYASIGKEEGFVIDIGINN